MIQHSLKRHLNGFILLTGAKSTLVTKEKYEKLKSKSHVILVKIAFNYHKLTVTQPQASYCLLQKTI
jgi:hypothetical protein